MELNLQKMNSYVHLLNVLLLALEIHLSFGDFDPFMDENWFSINWAGPAASFEGVQPPLVDDNTVLVITKDNEKYRCSIPDPKDPRDKDSGDSYAGASDHELIGNLYALKTCSYRIETFWTYELCHGKHLKQYHEQKEAGKTPDVQEYFLGVYKPEEKPVPVPDASSTESDVPIKKKPPIDTRKVEGLELPFYEVVMDDGTLCDLTGRPRKARILYVCQPEGRGEIYLFKEMSTCEYEVMVLTSILCIHPDYRPKEPDVSKIHCHSLDGAPKRPKRFDSLEMENTYGKYRKQPDVTQFSDEDVVDDHDDSTGSVQVKKLQPKSPVRIHRKSDTYTGSKSIGPSSDKQLLKEFLSGEYCLYGGAGWWKHEFCYGKFIYQFHDEPTGRTTIYLGRWDESTHLQWLQQNPHKRPKPVGKRRWISQFYGGGDVCDLTNQPRRVEVKLKCKQNPDQPHAVSLYLVEQVSCEYELVVESPIFCSLIDQADDNGIIINPNL